MDTYCGIILKSSADEACAVACLTGDGVSTYSPKTDERIIEILEDHRPQVIAMNAPQDPNAPDRQHHVPPTDNKDEDDDKPALDPATAAQFRSGEQELVAEGYNLLPKDMRDRRLLERAEFLSNTIKRSGLGSTIIESNPLIISKKLDITNDDELAAYGINTDDIHNSGEFDAVLLALTAKFFAEDNYEDKDLIVPIPFDEEEK